MPWEGGNSSSGTRLSAFGGEDFGYYAKDDAKERLHFLFAQIEKEFDALYMENLNLQEKLEATNGATSAAPAGGASGGGGGGGVGGVTGGGISSGTGITRIFNIESDGSASKNFKSRFGGGGGGSNSGGATGSLAMGSSTPNMSTPPMSKVKASHKLKAQTSRIVSSFKQPSVVCTIVREFNGHKDGVWEVATKSGQPIIGTASADRTACIWGIESGKCLLQYTGHGGSVNSLKFHPNRDLVLTASGDMTTQIWQAAVNWDSPSTRKGHSSEEELEEDNEDVLDEKVDVLRTPIAEFSGNQGHAAVVSCADWLTGGDQIITASWDRTAILWDVETKEALVPLTGHDRELTHASAHPTQRLVVTSSRDSTFRLWDFRDQIPAVSVFQGHSESVTSAVFTRDDKVVSGSDDRTVKVWELRNMRSALATIRTDSSVNRLAVSATGTIAIPHDNRHIRLFDLNGQRVARLPRTTRIGHRRMVSSMAWSDELYSNSNLFSCGFDRRVLGWNVGLPRENL